MNWIPEKMIDPLPERVYTVRVVSVEKRVRRTGPGLYLAVEVEVFGGEYDGRRVFSYYAGSTIASRFFYRQFLRGAGVHKARDLVGCHLRALIVTEEYRGRQFSRIRSVMP